MFLGGNILKRRIEMHMTQKQLAEGICNQNLISRIERNNTPPAINKLIAICLKLKLSLNDVYSEFSDIDKAERTVIFNSIASNINKNELQIAKEKISILKQGNLSNNEIIKSLFYEAYIIDQEAVVSADFALDKLLMLTKNDVYNIYTLMAYILKGKIYVANSNYDDAKYFFNLVHNETVQSVDIPNASVSQKAFICKSLADFYSLNGDIQLSKEYAIRGINICKNSLSLEYLPDLYKILSEIFESPLKEKYRNLYLTLNEITTDQIQ